MHCVLCWSEDLIRIEKEMLVVVYSTVRNDNSGKKEKFMVIFYVLYMHAVWRVD